MARSEWSAEQKERTRDTLERVDVVAFSFDPFGKKKGCTLNHLDGRYGYITLNDALSDNWRILDYQSDELFGVYDSIEHLIVDGWKVST
ncbi:MAG: hypothetical protein WC233_09705 [Sphaerochaeta sp.]|jgi:hypothetical protein|nr:hypothetical protein [Spirochaetales bacterium]